MQIHERNRVSVLAIGRVDELASEAGRIPEVVRTAAPQEITLESSIWNTALTGFSSIESREIQ